jgi:hypothetical protein
LEPVVVVVVVVAMVEVLLCGGGGAGDRQRCARSGVLRATSVLPAEIKPVWKRAVRRASVGDSVN